MHHKTMSFVGVQWGDFEKDMQSIVKIQMFLAM